MHTVDYATVFERAVGPRLLQAERFLLAWPDLFAGALVEAELGVQPETRLLLAVARFDPRQVGPELEARFAFWTARLEGASLALDDVGKRERANLLARLAACPQRFVATPDRLVADFDRLLQALGVSRDRRRSERAAAALKVDLGAPGERVTYDASAGGLYLRSELALPLGERLTLSLEVPGAPEPFDVKARVTHVRTPARARTGGLPAGFGLAFLEAPPALTRALDAFVSRQRRRPTAPTLEERRAHRRFPVAAPAAVRPTPSVRLSYPTEQALLSDYVENLSLGGAFVRTGQRLAMDAAVDLELELPRGERLRAPARVVRVLPDGVGLQFALGEADQLRLEEVIAHLWSRPRRALVVDDDALVVELHADVLRARGFEVLTARTADEALRILLDELLRLDVLLTDLAMPGMNGEALVRLIRREGGERDLAIVVVSGRGEAVRARPEGLPVDAVLDKAVGPSRVAEVVEKVVEERRRARVREDPALELDGRSAEPEPAKEVAPSPVLTVRYASQAELKEAAGALFAGGVFVRTAEPLPLLSEVQVVLELPQGGRWEAKGVVVSREREGVAVELQLAVGVLAELTEEVNRQAGAAAGPAPAEETWRGLLEASSDQSSPAAGRVGAYELVSLLGRGGMAEVYYARAVEGPRAGQTVALKRLLPQLAGDPEAVELFSGEADLSRLLDHPNIVRTHEVGLWAGSYFLVMEVVDGRDLGQLVRRCRKVGLTLPVDFCAFLAKSLLDALDYAHHAKGRDGEPLQVVHCDVSPSNLFISRVGEVKLGDFGVARARGLPGTARVAGKTHYLSPEALDGEVDVQGDLWAAAVCLYELLTLERPFRGETPEAVFEQVRARRYVPVRRLRPDVSPQLAAVVERAFEKKRSRRFESAARMRDALLPHFDERIGTPLAIAAVVRGLFDRPLAGARQRPGEDRGATLPG